MKKRLTQSQEFEIMKIVLDKFLWVGIIIMLYGLYLTAVIGGDTILKGVAFMIAGAVILVLFLILVVREYEVLR